MLNGGKEGQRRAKRCDRGEEETIEKPHLVNYCQEHNVPHFRKTKMIINSKRLTILTNGIVFMSVSAIALTQVVSRLNADTSISRPQNAESIQQQAAQVIRNYYDAINRRDYKRAYSYWGNGGAIHQSFDQFKKGFADTASVRVDIGKPGDLDAAAGSLYIKIPVTIATTTVKGRTQHFRGSYVLRRVNDVPGATPEQLMWHFYRADITPAH